MKTLFPTAMPKDSSDAQLFQLSSFSRRLNTEAIECPECGKHSIVKRASNVFDCISCGFHKELPPVAPRSLSRHPALRHDSIGLSSPSHVSLDTDTLTALESPRRQPRVPITTIPTLDPNHPHLDLIESVPEADKMQPLVFAAIAVIFGIIFL